MGSSEYEWRVTSVGSALRLLLSQDIRLPRQTLSSSPLPMQTTRVTRSSVLGKRGHQQQQESSSLPSKSADRLQTPDSTPLSKRPRVSTLIVDGDGNKENIPPCSSRLLTPDPSPTTTRTSRSLRRSGTEIISPSRPRHGTCMYSECRYHCSEVTISDPSLRVNVHHRVS
jgi:cell division control protein 6